MIQAREIMALAEELSLRPDVVEKDYVLGWMLHGIGSHPELAPSWIFKGGTCLKKCYFETYRFSEDLDFTVREAAHLDEAFLRRAFGEIAATLYEQAGIEIPVDDLRFKPRTNSRGGLSCEGRVYYRGPIRRQGSMPAIKLDLTVDERLVLEPDIRPVYHPYADAPGEGITIHAYAFEEVFAEKVRALGERSRPRDLYDVINLYRSEYRPEPSRILDVLREKCAFKGIPLPSMEGLRAYKDELAAEWGNMLAHQLPTLPPVESFWDALAEFFAWLARGFAPPTPAAYRLAEGDTLLRPQLGRMGRIMGGRPGHLEMVRFAAANRLCVDLVYRKEDGEVVRPRIEPYSLRRTRAGEIVLHVIRADDQQHRSYRIDRIQDVQVSHQTFTPRYAVELSPEATLSIPPTASRARTYIASRISAPRSRPRPFGGGVTYVYQCPICSKQFERKTQGSKLRPHKSPAGGPCSGRSGFLVNTKF
jgi:predicted nucleotidyltransferase component of viral defense system